MFFKFTTLIAVAAMVQVTVADQFNVTVGGPGVLAFNPSSVNASVGDTVTFTFMQKNHTVTQSTLANPCQLAEGGFDSGFVPVADTNTAGPFPQAQFVVQDTTPVWVYCRQANHCQQGMVFAINPGSKMATFVANAMGNSTNPSATSSSPPASSTSALPSVVTVTQTITEPGNGSTQTTTYQSYPGSASPSSSVSSDHKVIVGGSGLTFQPSNISAQVGDTITFQFMAKNHTATQSTFASPCQPMGQTSSTGMSGFDSGFMPVASNATNFPSYTVQVNNTTPIWVYCKQATHCQSGMVFSVNAVESGSNTFEAFLNNAKGNSSTTTGSQAPAGSASGARKSSTGTWLGAGLGIFVGSFWIMI